MLAIGARRARSRQSESIALSSGGATSHVAILAAAMDVPMLAGIGRIAARRAQRRATSSSTPTAGRCSSLHRPPKRSQGRAARRTRRCSRNARPSARPRSSDRRTRDGTRIEIFANLGSVAEAEARGDRRRGRAAACCARSSCSSIADRAPSRRPARDLPGHRRRARRRSLVLRLMDVGGDKPLNYLRCRRKNPALGLARDPHRPPASGTAAARSCVQRCG